MRRSLTSLVLLCVRGLVPLAAIALATPGSAAVERPLIRFPTISSGEIAFVAYGDLWCVSRAGGRPRRLTNDPGQVLTPRFSPDGHTIAFSWRREGGIDVYVVPAVGGIPTRLTHGPTLDSYDNIVTGWTPDGANVLFTTLRGTPFHRYETYRVSTAGGLATSIGLGHSGTSSVSPDGTKIAYDPTFRNLGGDRWKRYVGGQAPDIYVYDLKNHRQERLTDWQGIDTSPMWIGRRIYFLSDRGIDRHANVWVTDLDAKVTKQITHFTDYDVDMPSGGPDGIAFQQGGGLFVLDPATDLVRRVSVALPVDPRLRPRIVSGAAAFVRGNDIAGYPDYSLGGDGRTVFMSARGDLGSLTPEGVFHDLTNTAGFAEDHPSISPDGHTLAFITDAGGQQQVAVMPAGGGKQGVLTRFPDGVLYAPRWSADGSQLLVADANKRLWLVHLDGRVQQIAADPFAEIHDAVFSDDGKLIAYSTTRDSQARAIHLRDLHTGVDTVVSSPMESDHDPVFAKGHRLLFVSQRREQPLVSDRDREGTVATLKSDVLLEAILPAGADSKDLVAAMAAATTAPITLKGGVAALQSRNATVFYRATAASGIGSDLPGEETGLHAYDVVSRKDRIVANGVDGYVLSADGKTALIRRSGGWHIVQTAADASATANDIKVSTQSVQIRVDPGAENREMFEQAWKLDRDVFWDPKMNGADWKLVHARYARLVPMIGSHEDLVYLLGELQGELASSHMFLGGGDEGDARPRVHTALLGVDFTLDAASGRYRMAHIFRGDRSRSRFDAPLGDPALQVDDGDYLLAIDGTPLLAPEDPYRLLLGKKGEITLTVAKAPTGPGRQIRVDAISDESEIRKLDWIAGKRAMVDRLSNGRIGYVYLSDFEELGSEDFLRQYYPQTDKAAMVIDVRDNHGGFTSQWVLDTLRRPLAGRFHNREGGITNLPGAIAPTSLAVVTNIFSMSDGDQFPFFFRKWGMGLVVGQRTWGGVRGIKGPWRLMDGTYITVPKDSLLARDGSGIIENRGAEPDLIVDDVPGEELDGRDAQLTAAVGTLLAKPSSGANPINR